MLPEQQQSVCQTVVLEAELKLGHTPITVFMLELEEVMDPMVILIMM